MSLFKDKILLITGGTGSFGNAVLNRFLETDIKEIRIFSRDDIQHYINLYCFISNPPADKLEKVEMVLNSAIHLTKSLRYRDFYVQNPDKIRILRFLVGSLCK